MDSAPWTSDSGQFSDNPLLILFEFSRLPRAKLSVSRARVFGRGPASYWWPSPFLGLHYSQVCVDSTVKELSL